MSYPYAKYTISYQEAVALDATLPEVLDFGDDVKNKSIRDMVMDMYWNHEIAGETIGEFRGMLAHNFGTLRDYYNELIDAYQTKINMLDGKKTTTKINGTKSTDESGSQNYSNEGTSGNTGSSGSSNYDLPRSTASENRPSSKSEGTSQSDTSTSASGSNEYTTDKTVTNNNTIEVSGAENVIVLKKQYMDIIRNIYKECASNLQKCFLDIFW